jgi:hypothetical protein
MAAGSERISIGIAHHAPQDLTFPGSSFQSVCLEIPPIAVAGNLPVGVDNWDFFDGSLLAVGFREGNDVLKIEGTAVMIAPGLAISAKHLFHERYDHLGALLAGSEVLYAVGLRPGGHSDIWQLQHVTASNDGGGDLAILSLALVSDLPAGGRFTCLPLTARRPLRGEQLTIVGFHFDKNNNLLDGVTGAVTAVGQMYAAVGEVSQFYWPVRDSSLAPFPAFEILCGVKGGMSGGAVLDKDGGVVGVVSIGFLDEEPPTLGAWCVDVFGWHVTASWPRNFYPASTPIANVPVVRVLDRQHLTIKDDGTIDLRFPVGED